MTCKYIIILSFLLFYTNLIRYSEVNYHTKTPIWKQYWFENKGILFSLNLIGIFWLIYFLKDYKV